MNATKRIPRLRMARKDFNPGHRVVYGSTTSPHFYFRVERFYRKRPQRMAGK